MESFGARLKREREQRKITLDEIAVSTKIGTRFLAAIEEDHFDQLPGGIFNKGFVRAYARHLGMDENQAIADFVAATEPVLPEPPPPRRPGTRRPGGAGAGSQEEEPSAMAVFRGAFSPLCSWCWPADSRFGAFILARSLPAPASRFQARLSLTLPPCRRSKRRARQCAPSRPSPTPIAATAAGGPSLDLRRPPRKAQSPRRQRHRRRRMPALFPVLIKARQDSWVAITADGKQIVQDTLAASAEKSIGARDQIVIKTGNVGALEISFNGKKLAPQGGYNQVKTLTFDPNGLRP